METVPQDGLLYRLIWRWHFYAGLFVVPFAILLAVTGALYLFQPQIEEMLYARLYIVPSSAVTIAPDTQLRAAQAAFPEAKPLAYIPPETDTRSAIIRMNDNGRQMLVAVNPHTGAVLGALDDDKRLMQVIRNLHGKLLSGPLGQAVMELAASWIMVLLVTGLYLWWPRGRGMFGTIPPRFQSGGRMMWRDLHAVTGFWLSFFLIFMVLSGLPWSLVAGKTIKVAETYLGGVPQTGMGWDGGGSKTVKSQTTHQGWATDHAMHMAGMARSMEVDGINLTPMTIAQVEKLADKMPDLVRPYSIYLPVDEHGVYSVSSVEVNAPQNTAYIHIDQYTGKVISAVYWKDFSLMTKAIAIGVSLHQGQYFGLPNQLLNLMVCLGLIGLVIAGLVTWWKRRPSGRLAAPKAPSQIFVGSEVIGLMIILGMLMPLFGLSLIIILTGERIQRL